MIGDILTPTHLLFVLVVALLVLGPKRLPEVGRALGRGLRDFRNALNTDELQEQMISPTSPPTATPTSQGQTETFVTPVTSEPADAPTGSGDQAPGAAEQPQDATGQAPPEPSTASPEPAASAPVPERTP